jgi:dipeptidyl aminopeptidase/acylaminoacyl peptidase
MSDAAALVPLRSALRLDPARRLAACVTTPASSEPPRLELWRADSGHRHTVLVPSLGQDSQLAPRPDGQVLVCSPASGGLVLHTATPRRVAPIDAAEQLRLLPHPRQITRGTAGYAVTSSREDSSTIVWRAETDGLHRIARLPGVLLGGAWLDDRGHLLAAGLLAAGRSQVICIDLRTGGYQPLAELPGSAMTVVAGAGAGGSLILLQLKSGGQRIGLLEPGSVPRFPAALAADGEVRLLGQHSGAIMAGVETGTSTQLLLFHPRSEVVRRLTTEPGVSWGPAVLRPGAVDLAWSAPDRPADLVRFVRRPGDRWTAAPTVAPATASQPAPRRDRWLAGRVEEFAGAAGRLEAVVYGDPRHARQAVVVLHGGPMEAWRLRFDPLLQAFAGAGIAVVAPNVRGSTHYGAEHMLAIRGCWGGPDLADVLAVGRDLTGRRPPSASPPVLAGISYGAWLGLLAAAVAPQLWSGCAAVTPFTSPRGLSTDAPRKIRLLIARLGGLHEVDDGHGRRDLDERAADLRGPVLLIHGDRDTVIPVRHTRALHARLREAGRCSPLAYIEVGGAGHDLVNGPRRDLVLQHLVRFTEDPSYPRKEVNS